MFALAASPDGRLLAVEWQASTNAHVDVRDLVSGRSLYSKTVPFGVGLIISAQGAISFASGGREIVAAGLGLTTASEWPLELPTLRRFACGIVGRDVTREEWTGLFPNRSYMHVCP